MGKNILAVFVVIGKKKVPSTIFHPVNVTNEATTSIYVSTKNDRLCAYPAECQEVQFIDMSE